MSAPDSRDSKARPSLLSDTANDLANDGSRILANLEGRVAAQPLKSRGSKKPWLFAAVFALAGAGAFGAWQWRHTMPGNGEKLATAPAGGNAGTQVSAATPANASTPLLAAAAAAAAPASRVDISPLAAPSSSQAAIIVSDNAPGAQPAPSSASAASVAAASTADSSDGGRLSRALAAGAETPKSHASRTAQEQAKHPSQGRSTAKAVASHNSHERQTKRHAERVATERSRNGTNAAAKTNPDEDVDLLAALVARTKPYDARQGQAAAKAQVGSSAARKEAAGSGTLRQVSLAQQVAECSKRGLIEEQFCRWHVCADHWGKDPACPSSTPSVSH
ncbi:hypothetical protein B0G57_105166 [Trinickia symbiotica]|uniref:Uncharacterized protein n=1 Tax=Trinickia symbiotica TaxID=863227 RepID=A0A2N7X1T0_9BURK|nr:hypothetical protein [Trinickia symbiotica]PMS35435.1 hypothetical protein C0Z20_18275 [Trinickia symbiotica]PPK45458.1 hypothetical protein B0G57_105166 [Trinickia symbiotica]